MVSSQNVPVQGCMGDIGKETLFLTARMRAGFRTELMALQEEKRQQRQGWGRSIVVRGTGQPAGVQGQERGPSFWRERPIVVRQSRGHGTPGWRVGMYSHRGEVRCPCMHLSATVTISPEVTPLHVVANEISKQKTERTNT